MGFYRTLTPMNDSKTGHSLRYFQGRVYLATSWHGGGSCSDGIIGAYLYRANSSLDTWDQRLEIPYTGEIPYQFRTIEFDNKLYMATTNTGGLWRLNDTGDAVIQVISTSAGIHKLLVFNNRLYSSTTTGELLRLNLAGDAWETVCPRLSYLGDHVLSLAIFNNTIYGNMANYGLVKVNQAENAWEVVVSGNDFYNLCVYNNQLYSTAYSSAYDLLRLNGTETAWDTLASSIPSHITGEVFLVYYNRLYLGSTDGYVYRLNTQETEFENMFQNGSVSHWIVSLEIAENKLYFVTDCQTCLFRYDTMGVVDFTSDKLFDLAPATINFSFLTAESDFPIQSYLWTFNDGYTSIAQDPSHTFIRGTYNISLSVDNGIDTGSVTKNNYIDAYAGTTFAVDTLEKLQLIGSPGNALTSVPGYALHDNYLQTVDIDAADTINWNAGLGFDPISRYDGYNHFSGTYDGGNFQISNLYINRPAPPAPEPETLGFAALFCRCRNSTFRNVNLEAVNITGRYVAGLVGSFNLEYVSPHGLIDTCHVSGIFNGDLCGGLIRESYYTDIVDCSADVQATGTNCGGLVCTFNYGDISRCSVIFDVNSSGQYGSLAAYSSSITVSTCQAFITTAESMINSSSNAGGLLGYVYDLLSMENCVAEGTVSGGSYVGGLIGYCSLVGTIRNSHALCTIYGTYGVSGFIGNIWTPNSGQEISDCYFEGDVRVNYGSFGMGGFIGYGSCSMNRCHVIGNVVSQVSGQPGTYGIGGFLGYASGPMSHILDCYIIGDVEGASSTGGFAGYLNAQIERIENCYFKGDVRSYVSSNKVGGFGGDVGVNSGRIFNCYARGSLTCTNSVAYSTSDIGGFIGSLYNAGNIKKCFSIMSMTVPTGAGHIGGFAGNMFTRDRIEQCFSWGELSTSFSGYWGVGGFIGYGESNSVDCFSRININYTFPKVHLVTRNTYCRSSSEPFCSLISGSSNFTSTYSNTGIDIVANSSTSEYFNSEWNIDSSIRRTKLYFDFIPKGNEVPGGSSTITYGYLDYSNQFVYGFRAVIYGADHPTYPEGINIFAYQNNNSDVLVYSESHIFYKKFSIICENLGCRTNVYVNNVNVGQLDGENMSTNLYTTSLFLSGQVDLTHASRWEINRIGDECTSSPINQTNYVGGFWGNKSHNADTRIANCYSAGKILKIGI